MNVRQLPSSPTDPKYREIIERCQSPDLHPDDKAAFFRTVAKNDFWFFCRFCTSARAFVCRRSGCRFEGQHIFDHPYIFEFCREVQARPDGYLEIRPRGHLKTTVVTMYQTEWDFLDDPQGTAAIITWKIEEVGESFVDGLKQELEPGIIPGTDQKRNEVLAYHWPEIFWQDPESEAKTWKKGALNLKQHPGTREASISMMSLNAMRTSKHFTRLIYDDIVTEISASSPDACEDCTKKFKDTTALEHSAMDTRIRIVGTRWASGDTYEYIRDSGIAKVRPGAHFDGEKHGLEDCYTKEGESAFHPGSDWLSKWRLKMGDRLFFANMRNRCTDARSSFNFDQSWLHKRFYEDEPEEIASDANLFFFVDPAKIKKGTSRRSDYFSIVGLALRFDMRRYVIEMIRDRMSPAQFTKMIFDMDKYWRVLGNPIKAWFYESRGASLDIEYFESQKVIRKYHGLDIRPFDDNSPKDERIGRLRRPWESGEIILPSHLYRETDGAEQDMVQQFIIKEFRKWKPRDGSTRNRVNTGARNEDVFDALAQSESPKIKAQLEYPTEPIATSWKTARSNQERELIERNFPDGHRRISGKSGNAWAC